MAVQSNAGLPDAGRGSIVTMMGNHQQLLAPSTDNSVLVCSANAPDGTGLLWTQTLNLPGFTLTCGPLVCTGITAAAMVKASYGVGVYGVTPPTSQPAFPGTADGVAADDATVINAIVALLVSFGFCASS